MTEVHSACTVYIPQPPVGDSLVNEGVEAAVGLALMPAFSVAGICKSRLGILEITYKIMVFN